MLNGKSTVREISPAEVQALWENRESVRLVDVREQWEWNVGHIHGAILMPMGEFAARCRQELEPADKIVCICAHGIRSACAAEYLSSLGYPDVATMSGGISCYAGTLETQS